VTGRFLVTDHSRQELVPGRAGRETYSMSENGFQHKLQGPEGCAHHQASRSSDAFEDRRQGRFDPETTNFLVPGESEAVMMR